MDRRRRGTRGLTLLEILIVIGVLVLMIGIGVSSVGASKGYQHRTQTNKLATAIRHTFNRSVTFGLYMRMVLDIDSDAYWVEASDKPVFLSKEKLDQGEAEERDRKIAEEEEEAREKAERKGQQAPQSKRAKYVEDGVIPKVSMEKGIGISGVMAMGQDGEFGSGKAYLNFFPNGFVQPALIYTTDGDEAYLTLEVHPLTGKVTRHPGKLDPPRGFGEPADVEEERR